MKSFKIMTAAIIATSLLGSAAMAADVAATTDTSTPVVKSDTKTDVKAPIVKKSGKHVSHKKPIAKPATVTSSDKLDTSKVDSSAKTDTSIQK